MSAHEREMGQSVGIAGLPNTDPSTNLDAEKSKRRWLWNPFKDINLAGPNGLLIRLGSGRSYYGQGRPGKGGEPYRRDKETGEEIPHNNLPGETFEEYDARGGGLLRRCLVYPCDNIWYRDTLTNLGKVDVNQFNSGSGNDLGARSEDEIVTIHAGVCAADMVNQYGVAARSGGEERGSYGLRDLKPIAGMMDTDTVAELLKIVQPYAYKLTNLQQELQGRLEDEQTLLFDLEDRGPAYERIKGAKLEGDLNQKAEALRKMFLGGVRDATVKARFDFHDLIKQLDNAKLGKIGNKSMPSSYDEHVCFLLNEPVPSAVARAQTEADPDMKNAVKLLTDFVTSGKPPDNTDEVAEMRSILSQMRGERTRLEKIRKELVDAGQLPQE